MRYEASPEFDGRRWRARIVLVDDRPGWRGRPREFKREQEFDNYEEAMQASLALLREIQASEPGPEG